MEIGTVRIAPLDVFFVILALIMIIRCVYRGFVKEFMSVSAVGGGVAAAVFFSGRGTEYVVRFLKLTNGARLVSFLVIFIAVYLIIKIFEGIIQNLLEKLNLEKLDRSLGFFLGIVEGFLLVAVILILIQSQPFFSVDGLLKDSYANQIFQQIFPHGLEYLNNKV